MRVEPQQFNPERPLGFLVLEGVNGAGKSTLQSALQKHFTSKGINTLTSQEPGGTVFGKQLRELLLQNPSDSRTPLAEAFLFSADRAEHVETVIRPALEEKTLVILDRYFYSTIAFQGYGRGMPVKPLLQMSEIAIGGIRPDLVLLLDLDPEEGLRRNSGKDEEDCFEEEHLSFHRKLRNGFLKLSESLPEPFVVLDATLPQEELKQAAISLVERIVPK